MRLGLERLGQTEVEDLDPIVRRDHDVCWLEVAVNDALLVRSLERVSNLARDSQGLGTTSGPL